MEIIKIIIACLLIFTGVFFEIVSVLGVYKFKFVLNRMHSAAMADTMSVLFVLAGLIIISGFNFTSLKLAVIIIFLWISSPVSSHLISNLVATVDRDEVMDKCAYDNRTIVSEEEDNDKE